MSVGGLSGVDEISAAVSENECSCARRWRRCATSSRPPTRCSATRTLEQSGSQLAQSLVHEPETRSMEVIVCCGMVQAMCTQFEDFQIANETTFAALRREALAPQASIEVEPLRAGHDAMKAHLSRLKV